MPQEVVHTIPVDGKDVPLSDSEFRKGPPEVDVDGRTPFLRRTAAEQVKAWQLWLRSGRDVIALDLARAAAQRATDMLRAQPPPPPDEGVAMPERLGAVRDDGVYYARIGDLGIPMPEPLDVMLDARSRDVIGPPDVEGAFDPDFSKSTPAKKEERWQNYLEDHPPPPQPWMDAQVLFLGEAQRLAALGPGRPADESRCLACLGLDFRTDPKKSWLKVIGVLLAAGGVAGIAGGIGKLLHRPVPVAAPTGLTVTWTPGDPSGNDVSVTWVVPTTGSPAEKWNVALVPVLLDKPYSTSVTGSMNSAVIHAVPTGKYTVVVTGVLGSDRGEPAVQTLDIRPPTVPTPGPVVAPNPPTDVTVVADLSTTSGLRGLTVTWKPPATGSTPDGYTVLVESTATPPVDFGPIGSGPVTSYRFEPFPPGTYRAIVRATLDDTSSAEATSAAATTLTAAPGAFPGRPRNLTTHVFASTTTGKAALTIMWDPPAAGAEVAGYDVAITKTDAVRRVGLARSTTYDPIDDGPRTVALVSYNRTGRSKSVIAPVVIDHTKLDADGLSWAPVFAKDEVAEWNKLKDPIAAMDEKEFWDNTLRVLTDDAGDHGGLASYSTMLFVARLLVLWIDTPTNPPSEPQIAAIADQIASAASFPKAPPTSDFADRLAPWREAVRIVHPVTKKPPPVRYRLFGLVRALERYLGEHN